MISWLLGTLRRKSNRLASAESSFSGQRTFCRNFKQIENHVLKTPRNTEQGIQSLASYLVKPAKNEEEKAWAIFNWIGLNIEYDIAALHSKRAADQSSQNVLLRRLAVCAGFAELFKCLAVAAGLNAVTISGYAKGYRYFPGMSFTGPSDHAWNAVKINGAWKLLDPTWGAGHIDNKGQYIRAFNDFYFLTPSDRFIYDHFPIDPKWQLLSPQISKNEFEGYIYLRSPFFKHNLKMLSHLQGTIRINKNEVIRLFAPAQVLLSTRLYRKEQELPEAYTFVQRKTHEYEIHIVPPQQGEYFLQIYAKDVKNPGPYVCALIYRVIANCGLPELTGFPKAFGSFVENGAYLYEPLSKKLSAGKNQTFKLDVPYAEEVVVIINDVRVKLKKGSGHRFMGTVRIHPGKVGVFARFPGQNQYQGLVEYE